jgi:hypothetical protein
VGTGDPIVIAAGATMCVKTVDTENLSAQDVRCAVSYSTLDKNN